MQVVARRCMHQHYSFPYIQHIVESGRPMNDLTRITNSEDVTKNVVYVLTNWRDSDDKNSVIAETLGIDRSTIHRWMKGKAKPSLRKVRIIAESVGLDATSFNLPHKKFIDIVDSQSSYMKRNHKNVQQEIIFGSILKWKHLWDEYFERHRGTYLLYNRLGNISGTGSEGQKIAVSLLTINKKTERGIEFELHNIDNRNQVGAHTTNHYVYTGLMFPISDHLCFYGEEQSGNEPLMMVTSSSQTSPPTLLSGYLAAVAVTPELRAPAGTKILLLYKKETQLSVADVKNQLGIFPENQIPEAVRRHL